MSNATDTSSFPVYEPQRARPLFGLSIAVCVLSTVVLALRFWSRGLLPKRRYQADDWAALAAWPLVVGTAVCAALAMRHGYGVHMTEIEDTDPDALPAIFKISYVGELTWTIGIGIIRCSALLFYSRVFTYAGSGFRWWIIGGIIANILWTFVLGFVVIFQCSPVRAYWDPTVHGKCLATINIQLGSGITSIALDLYTLVLPMPIIWKLQMEIGKKLLTFATFALGYCVIVTTIGRTVTVCVTGDKIAEDFTWYFPNILYWIIIELWIAHMCISLPSLFALCHRARQRGFQSLFMSRNASNYAHSEDRHHLKPTNMSETSTTT